MSNDTCKVCGKPIDPDRELGYCSQAHPEPAVGGWSEDFHNPMHELKNSFFDLVYVNVDSEVVMQLIQRFVDQAIEIADSKVATARQEGRVEAKLACGCEKCKL